MDNPELEVREAKEYLLKGMIVFQLCVALVVAFAGDMFVSYEYSLAEMSIMERILTFVGMILGVGALVGLVGLWRRWRPARLIFTVCTFLMPALILFNLPVEFSATNAGRYLIDMAQLVAGATIAMLYLADMEYFFGTSVSDEASAAG